MTMIFITEN